MTAPRIVRCLSRNAAAPSLGKRAGGHAQIAEAGETSLIWRAFVGSIAELPVRLALPFAVVLSAIVLGQGAAAGDWLTYHNDRYGTTIDYPDSFKPQPAPGSEKRGRGRFYRVGFLQCA